MKFGDYPKAGSLDGIKNGEPSAAEHFNVNTEPRVNRFRQRKACGKKLARPRDQFFHQMNVTLIEAAIHDLVFT